MLGGEAGAPAEDPVAGARRLAPVMPGKIVAIGLNYLDHIRESGLQAPGRPLVFAKFPSSVIGPGEEIRLPLELTERVDWEVELGRGDRDASPQRDADDALGHVFGYTVANDVSARDLQFGDGQWVRGKSLDTFCPVGPVVVTADEIPIRRRCASTCRVNGELMQDASTELMVFGVAELISHCSRQLHARTRRPAADRHAVGLRRVHGTPSLARAGRRGGVRDRRHRYLAKSGRGRVGGGRTTMAWSVEVPESLAGVCDALDEHAVLLAGGTDVMPRVNDAATASSGWSACAGRAGGNRGPRRRGPVGAATTLARSASEDAARLPASGGRVDRLAHDPQPGDRRRQPVRRAALRRPGRLPARARRRASTSPGPGGPRDAPVAEVLAAGSGRGEFVTAVAVRRCPPAGTWFYHKAMRRRLNSASIVTVAAVVDTRTASVTSARIALGGVGARPVRARRPRRRCRPAADASAVEPRPARPPRGHRAVRRRLRQRLVPPPRPARPPPPGPARRVNRERLGCHHRDRARRQRRAPGVHRQARHHPAGALRESLGLTAAKRGCAQGTLRHLHRAGRRPRRAVLPGAGRDVGARRSGRSRAWPRGRRARRGAERLPRGLRHPVRVLHARA